MSIDEREKSHNEERAPDPNNGHHQPRCKEGFAENVLGCVHWQRPEHPVTQERRHAPIRGNACPALEVRLRAGPGGLVEFVFDDRIHGGDIVVRRLECQFLFAKIGPVEVLRIEEGDDDGVGNGTTS